MFEITPDPNIIPVAVVVETDPTEQDPVYHLARSWVQMAKSLYPAGREEDAYEKLLSRVLKLPFLEVRMQR